MHHILIIDDEEALRASLSFVLISEGYKVTTIPDGMTALETVKKHDYDLIVLDLMLPYMDGLELCWRIRQFSNIPIIILSAKDHDSDKVWGLKAGADDYITKPFSARELLARIEAVLRRTARVRSLS